MQLPDIEVNLVPQKKLLSWNGRLLALKRPHSSATNFDSVL